MSSLSGTVVDHEFLCFAVVVLVSVGTVFIFVRDMITSPRVEYT